MPPDDIRAIMDKLVALDAKIDDLQDRAARTETMIETEALRCPHREDIARGRNNVKRMDKIEGAVEANSHMIQTMQVKIASWAGFASMASVAVAELIKYVFATP